MTFGEKVRAYRKQQGKTGLSVSKFFSVNLLSIIPSLYVVEHCSYLRGDGFGSWLGLFLLICFLVSVFYFSLWNIDALRIIKKKLAFKKETYSVEDFSVEWLIAKSAVAPFTLIGLFLMTGLESVANVADLLVALVMSLIFGLFGSLLPALIALFYFDCVFPNVEEETDVATNSQLPKHFATEWASLTRLLAEVNQKGTLDVEEQHGISSDVTRLGKTLVLFDTLHQTNQNNMKPMIVAMFAQIEKNIQGAIDEADQKTIIEMKKQQSLLNK